MEPLRQHDYAEWALAMLKLAGYILLVRAMLWSWRVVEIAWE